MSEYKDCYVAFLDILGFKNLLLSRSCNDIKRVFDALMDYKPQPLTKEREVHDKVHYYIMSDSIVVYIDSQYENAFIALTEVCLQIQVKLTSLNPPILIRGAIEKGSLYCEDNIIFGEALSKAYSLECTLAKFPRIIFTEAIRTEALKNVGNLYVFDFNHMFYKMDDDMLYYIDYLNTFDYIPSLKPKSESEIIEFDITYFDGLLGYIELNLGKEIISSVRDKYLWLRKKVLMRIEESPELKKYFEGKIRKQREDRIKRFRKVINMEED